MRFPSLVGSESKDVDMAAYVRAADAIRDAFDCVVIIIHHFRGLKRSCNGRCSDRDGSMETESHPRRSDRTLRGALDG
jgi:RecA-family ATPase